MYTQLRRIGVEKNLLTFNPHYGPEGRERYPTAFKNLKDFQYLGKWGKMRDKDGEVLRGWTGVLL